MITALTHPLIDILVFVPREFLVQHQLTPGSYGIVASDERDKLLNDCNGLPQTIAIGGSAANSSVAAQALGVACSILGLVGDDPLGQQTYQLLGGRGINTPLALVSNANTGSCISFITPDGERTMRTCLGVVKDLDRSHVCEETIAKSSWLLLEGYFLTASEENSRALYHAIEVAKTRAVKIAYTASAEFVVSAKKDDILRLILPCIDLFFSNEGEAMRLTNTNSPHDALTELSTITRSAVVTCGADGAIGIHDGKPWQTKAVTPAAPVIDTTGAGDVFAGAFLAGIIHGKTPSVAARGAARLASLITTQRGAHLPPDAHAHWLDETTTAT